MWGTGIHGYVNKIHLRHLSIRKYQHLVKSRHSHSLPSLLSRFPQMPQDSFLCCRCCFHTLSGCSLRTCVAICSNFLIKRYLLGNERARIFCHCERVVVPRFLCHIEDTGNKRLQPTRKLAKSKFCQNNLT